MGRVTVEIFLTSFPEANEAKKTSTKMVFNSIIAGDVSWCWPFKISKTTANQLQVTYVLGICVVAGSPTYMHSKQGRQQFFYTYTKYVTKDLHMPPSII